MHLFYTYVHNVI